MKKLTILANEQVAYETERDVVLDDKQLAFLDKMDSDMDRGIKIQGQLVNNPDSKQRATFVAMNLIKGLRLENQAVIAASCAYLVNRRPSLLEVRANDEGKTVNIQLVEEH